MQEEHTTQQQDPQPYIYVYDSTDRSNRFTREQAARRQAASIKQPLSESQFAHRPPVMLEEVRLVESAHAVGACRASSRILPRQLKIHNS